MSKIITAIGSFASWPAATALIITFGVCLFNNGLTARKSAILPAPGRESKLARVVSSIVGLLFCLFAFLTILIGVLLPQGITTTFSLQGGERIDVPAEAIRFSDTNQVVVKPRQVSDLANQWDNLTEEERRADLYNLLESPPEGTYVWFKPTGSEDFEFVPWQSLTNTDRTSLQAMLESPTTVLDMTIH